ncbi:nucleosidase [Janibacter cremeus]|uniref:Putative 5'-methylthioadenosine/S-adenosylhomocysteine nucleosidase n=1 Tax=Janibacter cremeus TaxID=1285192 RepID=A0A852VUU0_9MICO|nr:nucleosidase [Janibacter cremeus]NYF98443.1 putative 5'-methylthioadenosine/S-adenosylhomocysteine nucleosidase [Janibacter cremeus]
MHLLVVAAIEAEAAHLPDDVEVLITGVGKTLAAVAVTRAICEHPRRDELVVVNIGTAGALREGVTGLHEIGTVTNHDLSAEAIRQLGLDPRERLELDSTHSTTLASGDVFVTDPAVRDSLAQRADLVDMEGYAIALACTELGVPVHLVKVVSDNADETAHDWSAAVDGCARDLGNWVSAFIRRR